VAQAGKIRTPASPSLLGQTEDGCAKVRANSGQRPPVPRNFWVTLYLVAMIAVIVGVDVLFFRHQFWPRLFANIGLVLAFVAFYFKFLK